MHAVAEFPVRSSPIDAEGRFHFIGESRNPVWDEPRYPTLWLYNLHYFEYLAQVSDANRLLDDWIRANPCADGPGWEPYPLSRRIVSWSKWLAEGNGPVTHMLESLAQQTEFLSRRLEFHLLANHLFANVKALLIASLVLDSRRAGRWRTTAERLLWRELKEQFFCDGGHFERSPMYHAVMLEDVLDIVNLGKAYDWPGTADVARKVPAMLGWLRKLSRENGQPMHFHDSVGGVAADEQALHAYASRLGIRSHAVELDDSGYLDLETRHVRVVMDAGPVSPRYQPGHSHAQALSVEAEVHGRPLFVNAGISTYESGALRLRQRSTKSHSTVAIDGENSAELWATFRVGRRPRLRSWRTRECIVGEHDGYRNLPGQPIHRRSVVRQESGFIVTDRIEGRGDHSVSANWLLHPDVAVSMEKRQVVVGSTMAALLFSGPVVLSLEPADYWPGFGRREPTQRIVCRYDGRLPVSFSMEVTISTA